MTEYMSERFGKRTIDVHLDVLEPHVNEFIDLKMQKEKWHFGHFSNRSDNAPNAHWNILFGHNREEVISNGYEWILPIWDAAFFKFDFEKRYDMDPNDFVRAYANGYTFGIEPHAHLDDGDFTIIYYPSMWWELKWDGGTYFYEDTHDRIPGHRTGYKGALDCTYLPDKLTDIITLNEYKGNSFCVFDADIAHRAQSVSRECYKLRYMIVFKGKTKEAVANRARLDYYKT